MVSSAAKLRRLLRNPQFQRVLVAVGKGAAGTAAASAGLALGIKELKKSLNVVDRHDLWAECGFDMLRHQTTSESKQITFDELTKQTGLTGEEFRSAARRLTPVELQFENHLLSGPSANKDLEILVSQWRERGYIGTNSSIPEDCFGRRLSSDAQGVDIGMLVPPYLIPQEEGVPAVKRLRWDPAVREAATHAIHKWGCVLLRGALDQEDVSCLREDLGLGSGAASRRATEAGQWILHRDPNVAMGRYTFGRLHCLLRGSPLFGPRAVAAHVAVAPLVHCYFQESVAKGEHVFLSEAQLIIADPCAERQMWHVDSTGGPGLTVLIPLTCVTEDRGLQEVLPGTHYLSDSSLSMRERWSRSLNALCRTHGGVVPSVQQPAARQWACGDALVLDGRLLHRGLNNDSLGAPVPMLVLRYDLSGSPPPGCSRNWLRTMTYTGSILNSFFRFYSFV